jgi:hypothetical protein
MLNLRYNLVAAAAVAVCLVSGAVSTAGELGSMAVSKHVDELLAKELYGGDASAKPDKQASDEVFLRRLSLDLIGVPPRPQELTSFSLDPSPDKRAQATARLLADKRFGANWARYWRDVIMFRRSEDRALLASGSLTNYLTTSFNENPHWDKIARDFITATGDIQEQGQTALIMAQNGNAEDTTAEVSRIFMGIQIQCAQCHDHPTDRWKREQFHELAAFFPRISVRAVRMDGKQRSFEVVAVEKGPKAKKPENARRGSMEHFMPDLQHPELEGKLMQPVFFVSGQKLEPEQADSKRRGTIADWVTDRSNRWFSKAYVNRMWSELVGRGFYEPVDDIGPDRQCSAPKTLDYLADRFAANKYDVKWLAETITATQAYGRVSRSRVLDESAPFTAACPQRLRGDQLYNALVEALGIQDAPEEEGRRYRNGPRGPRGLVNQTFGFDPSVRRDEIAGSIPQALFLMNAPQLAQAIKADRSETSLGKLLAETPDDSAVIGELYLRCLAREPQTAELKTCLDHIETTGDRAAACEDILWALVNSTEFLNRK